MKKCQEALVPLKILYGLNDKNRVITDGQGMVPIEYLYSYIKDDRGVEYLDLDESLLRKVFGDEKAKALSTQNKKGIKNKIFFKNFFDESDKASIVRFLYDIFDDIKQNIDEYNEINQSELTLKMIMNKFLNYEKIAGGNIDENYQQELHSKIEIYEDKIKNIETIIKNKENPELVFEEMYTEGDSYLKDIKKALKDTGEEEKINNIILNAESIEEIRKKCTDIYEELAKKERESIMDVELQKLADDTRDLKKAFEALNYNPERIRDTIQPRILKLKEMLKERDNIKEKLNNTNNLFFKFGRNNTQIALDSIEEVINNYRIVDDASLKALKEGNNGDFLDSEWYELGDSVKKSIISNERISFHHQGRIERIIKNIQTDYYGIFSKYKLFNKSPELIFSELEIKELEIKRIHIYIGQNEDTLKKLKAIFHFTDIASRNKDKLEGRYAEWKWWEEYPDDYISSYKEYLTEERMEKEIENTMENEIKGNMIVNPKNDCTR